ncbi:MAG: hypothetical protein NTV66_08955 [Methylococcales bacterium]|nr:hypothetical protein [Methylococcales bacterium]
MLTKLPAYLLIYVIFSAGIIFVAYDYYQDIELKFHQKINGVRNNLSSIENHQNRNCKKGEEGTITQI